MDRNPTASAGVEETKSLPSGIVGGVVAALGGVPALTLAFIIAEFSEKALFGKVTGTHVTSLSGMTPGQATLSQILVAGATGLFGAAIPATIALLLFKRAHRTAFLVVSAIGFTLWAVAVWRWAGRNYPDLSVVYFGVAWVGAMLGIYAATAVSGIPDDEAPTPDWADLDQPD